MEKRNLFVSGKAVVAAVCGAFTAAFGWLGWLVVAWAACMALDWVSGSAAAASRGAWSSAAARAGVPGCEVDGAARRVIAQAGYGEFFSHSFGHSLGLDIHESPNASPSVDRPLPAGAVVSAEPGIYLPGRFGVREEDLVLVTEDGAEVLNKLPMEFAVEAQKLLSVSLEGSVG